MTMRLAWLLVCVTVLPCIAQAQPAQTPFITCVDKAIARLDDNVSPADLIASAAITECELILQQVDKTCAEECMQIAINYLKPKILPLVLEFRAAQRKRKTQ